jgi:hypothetical protein
MICANYSFGASESKTRGALPPGLAY